MVVSSDMQYKILRTIVPKTTLPDGTEIGTFELPEDFEYPSISVRSFNDTTFEVVAYDVAPQQLEDDAPLPDPLDASQVTLDDFDL